MQAEKISSFDSLKRVGRKAWFNEPRDFFRFGITLKLLYVCAGWFYVYREYTFRRIRNYKGPTSTS